MDGSHVSNVDWKRYLDVFPSRYLDEGMFDWHVREVVAQYDRLFAVDIGGGMGTQALRQPHVTTYLLDPNVPPQDWMKESISWETAIGDRYFDLAVLRGSLNYLSPEQIRAIPGFATRCIANTFERPPPEKWVGRLYQSKDSQGLERSRYVPDRGVIQHELLPDEGEPICHEIRVYTIGDLIRWLPGAEVLCYGKNSVLIEYDVRKIL